ncbi:DPP IV N-terminal domain-containing protein [Chlamydiota bacterium]
MTMGKVMRLLFHSIFFVLVISGCICSGEVYLKISKTGQGKVSCAIPRFYYDGAGQEQLRSNSLEKQLRHDLEFSGYFFTNFPEQELNRLISLEKRVSALSPGIWKRLGAEIVVKAKVVASPDSLKGWLYVFNAADGAPIFAKKYIIGKDEFISLVHLMSDDIIYNIFGEKGFSNAKIVFISNRTGAKEVYVSDYDGRNVIRVTKDNSIIVSPLWSRSNKQLLYTSFRYDLPRIILHDFTTGERKILSKFPGLNACGPFAPQGDAVLMVLSRDGNPEIYRFDLSTLQPTRLTRTKAVEASPCWSPDGRKIAYVSDISGRPQIYVMDRNGKNNRRLTYKGYYNADPDWSPKGDEIVYSKRNGRGAVLSVISLDTGTDLPLKTGAGQAEDPSWAPDGRHVVYSYRQNKRYGLYMIDVLSGEKRVILDTKGDEITPSFTW